MGNAETLFVISRLLNVSNELLALAVFNNRSNKVNRKESSWKIAVYWNCC